MKVFENRFMISAIDMYDKWITRNSLHITLPEFGLRLCRLGALLFAYCVYLILKDIIENKVIFRLPTAREAYMEMIPIEGKRFEELRKLGIFEDVDYLVSNFKGYIPAVRIKFKDRYTFYPIYISKHLSDRLIELINLGETW